MNPLTSSRDAQAIQDAYVALNVQVGEASAVTPHICLMGDFNAHLGELSEGEGHALQHQLPILGQPRDCTLGRKEHNAAGTALIDMIRDHQLIATTGRGRGDQGQPSCRGATRTDHFLFLATSLHCLIKQIAGTLGLILITTCSQSLCVEIT